MAHCHFCSSFHWPNQITWPSPNISGMGEKYSTHSGHCCTVTWKGEGVKDWEHLSGLLSSRSSSFMPGAHGSNTQGWNAMERDSRKHKKLWGVLVGRSTKCETHGDVYIVLLFLLEHYGSYQRWGRCEWLEPPTQASLPSRPPHPLAAFYPLEQVPPSIHFKILEIFESLLSEGFGWENTEEFETTVSDS